MELTESQYYLIYIFIGLLIFVLFALNKNKNKIDSETYAITTIFISSCWLIVFILIPVFIYFHIVDEREKIQDGKRWEEANKSFLKVQAEKNNYKKQLATKWKTSNPTPSLSITN